MPKGNALLASRETLSSPPPATLTNLTGPVKMWRSLIMGLVLPASLSEIPDRYKPHWLFRSYD
jgi:hypothetical protein